MPTAEAHIATERASRYLVQLCSHLGHMKQMRHQPRARRVEHVDYSDTYGSIRFADGLCTLQATPDRLILRIDSDDQDALQRLREGIGARLAKIGRRDGLTVAWQEPQTPVPSNPSNPSHPSSGAARLRGRGRTVGLIAVGALVVVMHLGLFGAALAGSAWTGWAANGVLALVALKLVFMGAHIVLGRFGVRRGKAFMTSDRRSH